MKAILLRRSSQSGQWNFGNALSLFFLFLAVKGFATTYYVSSTGNDGNLGTSEASAWQSLTKVNSFTPQPGDQILFRRGDTWTGSINVTASGTDGHPITYGAYGTGDKPIITLKAALIGWNTEANWTESAGTEETFSVPLQASSSNVFTMNTRNVIRANTFSISGIKIRVHISPSRRIGSGVASAYIGEQASIGDAWDMEPGTITQITFTSGSTTLDNVLVPTYSDWIVYTFDKMKSYLVSIGTTGGFTTNFGEVSHRLNGKPENAGIADVGGYSTCIESWFNMAGIDVFSDTSMNHWYKTMLFNPTRVWLSGTECPRAESLAKMDNGSPWFYDSKNKRLYIHSTSHPATNFSNIEINATSSESFTVSGTNKDYITIRDLDIQGGYDSSIRLDACNSWIIEDCNIGKDAGTFGLSARVSTFPDTCNNVIIRRCVFDSGDRLAHSWYVGENGFGVADGMNLRAGCNHWDIYDNTFLDWSHCAFYIVSMVSPHTVSGNKFHHNEISSPHIDYGRALSVDGLKDLAMGNEIYCNYIHDVGVRIQLNANGTKFYNNIIDGVYNSRTPYRVNGVAQGLMMEGYSNTFPQDMEIYNNIFANCDEAGLLIACGGNSVQHNSIRNNIFYNCGAASKKGWDNYQIVITDHVGNSDNTFQNNLLYKNGVTDLVYYGRSPVNDYPHTIAEFNSQNGTATDVISNNIGGDPLFVSTTDYRLQAGSPAINAGVDVGLTEDREGNPIVGLPDIGACAARQSPVGHRRGQSARSVDHDQYGGHQPTVPLCVGPRHGRTGHGAQPSNRSGDD